MDDYAGRVLADRYRLPLPPSDEYEFAETRAFDTYSGHEVLVRQVPLPEIVDAEVLDADGLAGAAVPRRTQGGRSGGTTRRPADPAVRRAVEAAQAAAQIPDHPRLDQVFDVFAEDGSLWIVSERVAARPLAALLAEKPLTPYRAAEIASDVLTALRVLHAHGWTHRNITVRTVLVCEDGRVVLTGLASGAAEEALCGYAPVPEPEPDTADDAEPDDVPGPLAGPGDRDASARGHEVEAAPGRPVLPQQSGPSTGVPDVRAARAGAIAAYRAGARAGARTGENRRQDENTDGRDRLEQDGLDPDWWARRPDEGRRGLLGLGAVRDEDDDADFEDVGLDLLGPPRDTETHGRGERHEDRYDGDRYEDRYGAQRYEEGYGTDRDGGRYGADRYEDAYGDTDRDEGRYRDGSGGAGHGDRHGDDLHGEGRYGDDRYDRGRDGEGPAQEGPGRVRLTGTWHDAPFAGREGMGSLPAGGGGPRGIAGRPELPGARPHDPYRDDPYGVRRAGAEPGRGVPPARPALPVARADSGPGAGGRPAGGQRPALPAARTDSTSGGSWHRGGDALRADAQRRPAATDGAAAPGRWDEVVAGGGSAPYRGPATPLAAERARQARITVVGAVTERWAPEQAGPVHENWQLAAPVGPATDLWALGALLYRAVQGHAPYPEESAAELVQLVCAEPPAFAEECGALRPVVESLLRQDPTERPDFEELRGWLRSLVRSAPEPEAGTDVVPLPAGAVDGSRLPIVRRRGELVRRRRGGGSDAHGRHRHKKTRSRDGAGGRDRAGGVDGRRDRPVAQVPPPRRAHEESYEGSYEPSYRRSYQDTGRKPRALGRTLLLLILLALVAAIAYAVLFMPKAGDGQQSPQGREAGVQPSQQDPSPGRTGTGTDPEPAPTGTPGSQQPQTSAPAGELPEGYVLRDDPEGFRIAVDRTWQRRPINDAGQVRYTGGDFTLIVVPGRDSVQTNGEDPLVYQRDKEPELQPFRDSSWASATGLRRIDVGGRSMAEGQFTWQDSNGREVYVRNLALAVDGTYHVVQVIGPEAQRDKVTEIFEQATASYRSAR
ncbi:protein kinase [Streptomyces pristinaespiralis]|uniref:Serine/threonine protein kinase n=1 Tax=Streptomyces pristinaespiralis TaxID=38300 RepID=A0A0M4D5C7_STRPR|nr:protein kinase [Streptomyces pristinaespiralis]ALC21416.1 serine/threonine protein kinase [Streptomyces pristinaespiralis]QMU15860.1 protein kinase [Streptomyces pristinaespiralis]